MVELGEKLKYVRSMMIICTDAIWLNPTAVSVPDHPFVCVLAPIGRDHEMVFQKIRCFVH